MYCHLIDTQLLHHQHLNLDTSHDLSWRGGPHCVWFLVSVFPFAAFSGKLVTVVCNHGNDILILHNQNDHDGVMVGGLMWGDEGWGHC